MRQVDFSADIPKRDAIVKAFKVRRTMFLLHLQMLILPCSMHGRHMVENLLPCNELELKSN